MTPRKLTRRDRIALWFAVAAGPASWATQLALGYLLVIGSCESGSGTDLIGPLVAGSSVALGLVVLAAAATALRLRRTAERGEIDDERGRVAAMATIGARWSILFLAMIALDGLWLIPGSFCGPS